MSTYICQYLLITVGACKRNDGVNKLFDTRYTTYFQLQFIVFIVQIIL